MSKTNGPVASATEQEPTIDTSGMERIVLTLWDENEQPTVKKSFTGRWLVGDSDEGVRADDERSDWDAGARWSVALTRRGRLVVYCTRCDDRLRPEMKVYEDFDEIKADESLPGNVIAVTADALGLEYEIELDI